MTTASIKDKIPFKLLELNLISAQDLSPVSKVLHTYVVAWVHPDHKLSTPVDHKGHTKPKWNYRMVFRVDDKFLRSDSSALMIEIHNITRLSSLPIGTARIPVQFLMNDHSSLSMRPLALSVCRPSGQYQGILNVSVNLVGVTIRNRDEMEEKPSKTKEGDDTSLHDSTVLITSNLDQKSVEIDHGSIYSEIKPLSTEMAAALENGLYDGDGSDESADDGVKTKTTGWDDEKIPLAKDKKRRPLRRRNSDGGRLFSWLTNGFECSFICGSSSMKNNKKNKLVKISNSNGDLVSLS